MDYTALVSPQLSPATYITPEQFTTGNEGAPNELFPDGPRHDSPPLAGCLMAWHTQDWSLSVAWTPHCGRRCSGLRGEVSRLSSPHSLHSLNGSAAQPKICAYLIDKGADKTWCSPGGCSPVAAVLRNGLADQASTSTSVSTTTNY
jgi:hypothetical protein